MINQPANQPSNKKYIYCPNCNSKKRGTLCAVFDNTQGDIEVKCPTCKAIITYSATLDKTTNISYIKK